MDFTLWLVEFLLGLFVFIFGVCIGSFLNVIVYRVPHGISIAKGRSFCPNCHETLRNVDLIPIFSFLFLRGKCHNCKQKISLRYPLVETFTGLIAVLCYLQYGYSFKLVTAFAVAAILIAISLIDLDTMTIPNGLLIAMIVPAAAAVFAFPETGILSRLIGFFAVSLPLLLLTLCIRGSFGGGDIKLMAVGGFLLGWKNTILAGFIGILLGGIAAVILLVSRKKGRKEHMAFGPYLAVGIFVALLYGDRLIGWYLRLFGLV